MSLDTEAIAAAAASISEPVRAAILATVLATAMVLKGKERTIYERAIEVTTLTSTCILAGYGLQSAGVEAWAIYGANAIIVYLGVDKLRAVVSRVVDGFLAKKGV
jgi:hypothetical protein